MGVFSWLPMCGVVGLRCGADVTRLCVPLMVFCSSSCLCLLAYHCVSLQQMAPFNHRSQCILSGPPSRLFVCVTSTGTLEATKAWTKRPMHRCRPMHRVSLYHTHFVPFGYRLTTLHTGTRNAVILVWKSVPWPSACTLLELPDSALVFVPPCKPLSCIEQLAAGLELCPAVAPHVVLAN